jgi:hypothetical protein
MEQRLMGWNVVIKTIKGRRYAYRQRSFREPGKKNPSTITQYLGPVVGDDVEAFKAAKLAELNGTQETEDETLRERRRMASHIGLDLEKGETIDDMMRRQAQQVIDNAADWAYKTMGEPKDRPSRVEKPVGIEAPDKPPSNASQAPDHMHFPDALKEGYKAPSLEGKPQAHEVSTSAEYKAPSLDEKSPTQSEANETETTEEPTAAPPS